MARNRKTKIKLAKITLFYQLYNLKIPQVQFFGKIFFHQDRKRADIFPDVPRIYLIFLTDHQIPNKY